MSNNKALNLIGLCQRAGKLVSGDCMVKSAVKGGRAKLLVLAEDASDRTQKEFYHLVKAYKVKLIKAGTKAELGLAIGKSPRAAVAVTDENFAKGIIAALEGG